jgi:hypothetical protein
MGTLHGWTMDIEFLVQESDGPLVRSVSTDGHGDITWSGKALSVGQKTPDEGVFVVAPGSRVKIVAGGNQLLSTKRGAQTVADVPTPVTAHLDLHGARMSGFANLLLGKTHPHPEEIIDRHGWVQGGSETDQEVEDVE